MGKRNLYLHTTPVEEAWNVYKEALSDEIVKHTEWISAEETSGRITAAPIYAVLCSPLFNAAAMDGIAVRAASTRDASEEHPVSLSAGRDFEIVDTGDPVYPPYDAVIMAEDLLETDEEEIRIMSACAPWNHVRPIGEDIVAGEMLLSTNHKIRPVDIGVLLSGGILKVKVFERPKVGIIPTGTEMIEPGEKPGEGAIIESNSRMFAAMVQEYGGKPRRYPVVNDDYDRIKAAVLKAAGENDILIVNAGSSAGTEDYTVHVLKELGEVLVHGVAVKPGKPVILSVVEGKPVIGLPGYPVSAYIDFENFVRPVMAMFSGESSDSFNIVRAVLTRRIVSSLKHREYVRVKVGEVDERLVASPLARGAGAAMSLVRADGFCVVDQKREGYEAGETVNVELYRTLKEIRHTIVSIGSHDLILDILADILPKEYPGIFLSSTHVGSMAGLMALKRGETHLAPIHLLDEETGLYNLPYLKRLFPGQQMALIKGVRRIQGLIVKKGNPKNIQSVEDLVHCHYVNRQRGAGTRILLDYKLKQAGISHGKIQGYDLEAATHMAAAALVKSGGVDAAMGIYSAARAMELDFIPIGEEEYDFAIARKNLNRSEIQAFIHIVKSEAFAEKAKEAGGYSLNESGRVVVTETEGGKK